MTKEELRQEAEAEADKVIIGSGMDRTSVIHLKHLLVTMYIQGATKVTKELEAQIEKMKMCCNCDRWRDNPILDKQNLDDSSYPCIQHNCDSRCSLWEIWKND